MYFIYFYSSLISHRKTYQHYYLYTVYPVHTVVCVCVTCGVMRFVPRIHTHHTYLLDLRTLRIIRGVVYATLLDTPGLETYASLGKAMKYNSVAARNLLLYSDAFCIVDSADLNFKSCNPSFNKFSARLIKL